jgi:hypothetical protein
MVKQSSGNFVVRNAKGMVCLQRYIRTPLEKKRPQPSTLPAKPAIQPSIKKQKLAATSTTLTDML